MQNYFIFLININFEAEYYIKILNFYLNIYLIRFEAYEFVPNLWPPNRSYEQTNIFLYACAASVIAAVIYSKGAPYRKPIYTNCKFLNSFFKKSIIKYFLTDFMLLGKLKPYFMFDKFPLNFHNQNQFDLIIAFDNVAINLFL